MPLLRIKSEKDLRSSKLRKSPKTPQVGFAGGDLPAVPRLPSRLDTPPQLPLPDFMPSSSARASPSPTPSASSRRTHRRSRSIGTLTSDLSPSSIVVDQPWRTREAWQALHSRPSSPAFLPLPNTGAAGWRGRGGGAFFGGTTGDEVTSVRSEGRRRARTPTRHFTAPTPTATPPPSQSARRAMGGGVVRSHTDGDLSALVGGTPPRRPSDDVLGSIIDDYSPLAPGTWTTGTAGALYRQKTMIAQRPESPISGWNKTSEYVRAEAIPKHVVQETPRSSVDSYYPPTLLSDHSTNASTEESVPHTSGDNSRTPTPPRGSVDVPSSPSQSPWMPSPTLLPALLPPANPGVGNKKSFTNPNPPKDSSPVPWGRKSPSQKSRRRSYTSPAASATTPPSVPQTPLTPPDLYAYTAADVPHTPSPPHLSTEWLHTPRTPLPAPAVRPPISVRGSSVRPFLHSSPHASPAFHAGGGRGEGLRPPATIVSRSTSSSSFRDALPPPPIPGRASSAPRGASASAGQHRASPARPSRSPMRQPPIPALRGRMRRVDSYQSGWSKETGWSKDSGKSGTSGTSGGSGSGESRISRGGWI